MMKNYMDAKKAYQADINRCGGVTWETAHEAYQLYYNDTINDVQMGKLEAMEARQDMKKVRK